MFVSDFWGVPYFVVVRLVSFVFLFYFRAYYNWAFFLFTGTVFILVLRLLPYWYPIFGPCLYRYGRISLVMFCLIRTVYAI